MEEREKLEKIVKESKTITEVIKKLGLRAAGGNYKSIRNRIEKFNIDYSHFDVTKIRNEKLINFNKKRVKPLNEILISGSTYNRGHLKNRLYEEGLKEMECELCGQGEEWRGKKMSLILDHINGIHNDNRLENLRIVCPNCNATLDTHCGKNKTKRGEKLINLGYSVNDDVDLRKELTEEKINSYLDKRIVERPPYEQLINEIEEMGYSATGRKYGVSDNAIRKWVKSYIKMKI